jgi:hypothetical protein
VVVGLAGSSLYLFGHVVHRNKYVQTAEGGRERSHEIDAPYIKDLNNKNGVEGHHISV